MDVVNIYWYGGHEKLPSTVKYIGRGTPFGNPFKTTDHQTREVVVAKHWLYLHNTLKQDPEYTQDLMALEPFELGCTCKNPHVFRCCHGDNIQRAILRNKNNGWEVGQPYKGTLGIKDVYTEYLQKLKLKFPATHPWYLWMDELDLEIRHHIRVLREEDQHSEALLIFALCAIYFQVMFNEDRPFDEELIKYNTEQIQFYLGNRKDLPVKLKPPKKKKEINHDDVNIP